MSDRVLTPTEGTAAARRSERPDALAPRGRRAADTPISARARDRHPPLSLAQRRLWFLSQLDPESPAYNVYTALRIAGPLNVRAFGRAIAAVLARHEALRTRIDLDETTGEPIQTVRPPASRPVPVIDLDALPPAIQVQERLRIANEEIRTPFVSGTYPLLRMRLVRCGAGEHMFVINMHHMISDGWSVGVFVREVTHLYAQHATGGAARLSPLPIQYGDYAAWQQSAEAQEALQAASAYWTRQLERPPAASAWPADFAAPATGAWRGEKRPLVVGESLADAIDRMAAAERATPFMVLLAALFVLLRRYIDDDDLVIGCPVANRTRPEMEPLIGFFVNTVALRADLSGDPGFREVLRLVRTVVLDAHEHQALPFDRVIDLLGLDRGLGHAALFRTMFVFQNAPREIVDLGGVSVAPVEIDNHTSKFDLVLVLSRRGRRFEGSFQYNSDVYESASIEQAARAYLTVLEQALRDPLRPVSRLRLVAEADHARERAPLPIDVRAPYPCLHERLQQEARRDPTAVAIASGPRQLLYGELLARATRLSSQIAAAAPDCRVAAVFCDEGFDAIVSIAGVLHAGCAFVCLDPNQPEAALRHILHEVRAGCVIVDDALASRVPAAPGVPVLPVNAETSGAGVCRVATPGDPAYIAYTSGSTGRPKGIRQSHAAFSRFVEWASEAFGLAPGSRMAHIAPLSYDAAYAEIFSALCAGATVCPAPALMRTEPAALAAWVDRERITTLQLVPSVCGPFLDALEQRAIAAPSGDSLATLLLAGEALPVPLAHRLLARFPRRPRILNLYGPSESVLATAHRLTRVPDRALSVPVGRPIAGRAIWILDRHGELCPPGAIGEICVRSEYLADGYVAHGEETARLFIQDPDPRSRARVYRTGDRGRWRADGLLEFRGRGDNQVKLRGRRIELEGIEAHLAAHPAIAECAVTGRASDDGDQQLVAFLVVRGPLDLDDLRAFLRRHLPEYMVPSAFHPVDALPRTTSGKVHRRALANLRVDREPEARLDLVAPRTGEERMIAAIWCEVLGIDACGIDQSFFDLGGHSLLVTKVLNRLRMRHAIEIEVRRFFEAPTVRALAEIVSEASRVSPAPSSASTPREHAMIPRRAAGDATSGVSLQQESHWFLHRLLPSSAWYNLSATSRWRGPLDVTALARTLDEIVRRHDVMRSAFPAVNGRPALRTRPPAHVPIPRLDLEPVSLDRREAAATAAARQVVAAPFDLDAGPLFRVSLIRLAREHHVLVVALHHIIFDGWSASVLMREARAFYAAFAAGAAAPPPPSMTPLPPIQYADYAAWQRARLDGPAARADLDAWGRELAGVVPLRLPHDVERRAVHRARGAACPVAVPAHARAAAKEICRVHQTTMPVLLLAAYTVLLWSHSGSTDIAVGMPVAGRDARETEDLIGLFANTVVVRTRFAPAESFVDLLRTVRGRSLDALARHEVPFERVVERVGGHRDGRSNPLVQVMFSYQNMPRAEYGETAGVSIEPFAVGTSTSRLDLALTCWDSDDGRIGNLEYDSDLFTRERVERLARHLEAIVAAVAADPTRSLTALAAATEAERLAVQAAARVDVPSPAPVHAPRPQASAARVPHAPRARRRAVEAEIAAIWRHVLGHDITDVDQRFFDVGGTSMAMVQVHDRLTAALGQNILLVDMFGYPTIRGLAAFLCTGDASTQTSAVSMRVEPF